MKSLQTNLNASSFLRYISLKIFNFIAFGSLLLLPALFFSNPIPAILTCSAVLVILLSNPGFAGFKNETAFSFPWNMIKASGFMKTMKPENKNLLSATDSVKWLAQKLDNFQSHHSALSQTLQTTELQLQVVINEWLSLMVLHTRGRFQHPMMQIIEIKTQNLTQFLDRNIYLIRSIGCYCKDFQLNITQNSEITPAIKDTCHQFLELAYIGISVGKDLQKKITDISINLSKEINSFPSDQQFCLRKNTDSTGLLPPSPESVISAMDEITLRPEILPQIVEQMEMITLGFSMERGLYQVIPA